MMETLQRVPRGVLPPKPGRIPLLLGLVLGIPLIAGTRVAGEDDVTVIVRAGRVITAAGEIHEPGMVVIEEGRVKVVGSKVEHPGPIRFVDAPGETVLPGLVLLASRHGLESYSLGGLQAARKASDEVLLEEIDLEPLLEAGITTVAFIPPGSGITGSASAYHTAGDSSARLLAGKAYLRISMDNPGTHKGLLRNAIESAKKEIEKVKKAREEWEKKRKEAEAKKKATPPAPEEKKEPPKPPPPRPPQQAPTPPKKDADSGKAPAVPEKFTPPKINPNLQPFVDILEGRPGTRLVFELSGPSDLLHLDDVLEEYPKVKAHGYTLSAAYSSDYREVASSLGERKALVALAPVITQVPYTVQMMSVPAELAQAGCEIAFLPRSDSPGEYAALRQRAAELVRAGLSRETTLRALTLVPAKLLGLDKRIGSLEKGKEADLVFLDGDPLNPLTRVTRVMVSGRIVWEKEDS